MHSLFHVNSKPLEIKLTCRSLRGIVSYCVGGLGCLVCKLDILIILRFPHRMKPGYQATSTTDHSLNLLLELLVQQSVHKRVDSRIEQDHRVNSGDWDGTNVVGCNIL